MQDYRKLQVWVKAHALAVLVHRLSAEIPRQENAGLIGQILLKRIRATDGPVPSPAAPASEA